MRFRLLIAVLTACVLAATWGCSSQRSTEPVTKTGNPFERIKKPDQ